MLFLQIRRPPTTNADERESCRCYLQYAVLSLKMHTHIGHGIYNYHRRLGVSPTRKSFRFVSFVRACMRARGLVAEWNPIPKEGPLFSLFPFGWGSFSFSPPPTPNLLSDFSYAHRYMYCLSSIYGRCA